MIKKILLICILLLTLAPQAVGFEHYAMQDVTMPMELLELNYNIGDDSATITETIVFRNNGDTNYSGDLHIMVPGNAQIMQVRKMGHAANATPTPITHELNGETLHWAAAIDPDGMAMYSVRYAVPIIESGEFVKNLDPAVANYPIGAFKLKVNTDASVKFTDGAKNAINPDETSQEGDGGVLYTWSGPVAFKELHIKLSQPSNSDKWIVYGIIALLVISALLYPILHVRNNKLREKEMEAEKGRNKHPSRDRDDENDEEPKEGEWEELNSIVTEVSQTEKDLRRQKRAILAVLNKLEEDRDAGAVSDADYKRISSKYEKQAIEIMKQLDRM